ncbi:amidohydrolase family-domain-containing protein [Hyaloraphidium curvatum]|nr:amidohydrolase family-domain-containing protein [Hyaloraphidium curvatum]
MIRRTELRALLLFGLLACAARNADAAPAAGVIFARSCSDCDVDAFCEFAHPDAPQGSVACVTSPRYASALYRRYGDGLCVSVQENTPPNSCLETNSISTLKASGAVVADAKAAGYIGECKTLCGNQWAAGDPFVAELWVTRPTTMAEAVTVYHPGRFFTMGAPAEAEAVAVRGRTVAAVGSLAEVLAELGGEPHTVDARFAGLCVFPGFVEQHLHPILVATTMTTEVISTETWTMPDGSFPAAMSQDEYRARLRVASAKLADPDEWLFSWGYHALWHGPLDRAVLDEIAPTRPVGVWHRSAHEFYVNSAAIARLALVPADFEAPMVAATSDIAKGHFWETGFFVGLLKKLGPVFLTKDRLVKGLKQMVEYLHANGVTAFNEPGIVFDQEPFQLYQAILGADAVPMYSTFMVDARTQADKGMDPKDAVADAQKQVAIAPEGKVRMLDKHVKLFMDGAIISQLMQMKDPYLDDQGQPAPHHHGEWLMKPDVLEAFAKVYWDAGWQLHIHVNGDLGLETLLDALERVAAANPREDHRTVIVHFANSTEALVDRIAALGAHVSANPYYVTGFSERFARSGLGPERADSMVRAKSVLDRGIPLSFHSDMPMGPADPLFLAWCGANRFTETGRIAAPEQRIPVADAMRAITIEAARSWRMEDRLGSIEKGKVANFTVLAEDPYAVDPSGLDAVDVVGTMFEGRWFPVPEDAVRRRETKAARALWSGEGCGRGGHGGGCVCKAARALNKQAALSIAGS